MKLLFMDFETTGLIKNCVIPLNKQPHAIEYYGCIVDSETLEIENELDTLFFPPVEISAEITKITGIKSEDVIGAPKFAERADEIEAQMNACDFMVAHNASYDGDIMRIEFERLGRTPRIPRLFCTVEQTYPLTGVRLSLTALHDLLFGEKFSGAHRAKDDVQALVRCYRELVKRGEI